jgi:hypothetical protein
MQMRCGISPVRRFLAEKPFPWYSKQQGGVDLSGRRSRASTLSLIQLHRNE